MTTPTAGAGPLERLLAEELPTGLFGGPRIQPVTPAEAAEHRAVLKAALHGWTPRRWPVRHLHPATDHQAA